MNAYRKLIHENIDYGLLLEKYPGIHVDRAVSSIGYNGPILHLQWLVTIWPEGKNEKDSNKALYNKQSVRSCGRFLFSDKRKVNINVGANQQHQNQSGQTEFNEI